eukprot:gene33378-55995_t
MGGVALACLAGRSDAAESRLKVAIPARAYADARVQRIYGGTNEIMKE